MDDKELVTFTMRGVRLRLELDTAQLEAMVVLTPTGKRRELITEANILLHEARRKLSEAREAD